MTETLFGEDLDAGSGRFSVVAANGGNDEWLTPPDLVRSLGAFDLDPCAPAPDRRPWDTAAKHYDAAMDGLRHPWHGRVWLNPPYSKANLWLAKMADHNHGTALLFARTETVMWQQYVWPRVTAVLFLAGRLSFHYVDGRRARANSGAPSALLAYGQDDAAILAASHLGGALVTVKEFIS